MSVKDRFLSHVEKTPECWVWRSYRQRQGYGVSSLRGKTVISHRVSYELHCGPIPKGMWVLHHCDNPPCVNPAHLYLGTAIDNARDRELRGRGHDISGDRNPSRTHPHRLRTGERHQMAKLTESAVRDIRSARARGVPLRSLADRYSVSESLISMVASRRIWKHM